MRAFVAVVPPEPVLEDLAAYLEPRREAGRDLRWADPLQAHVTLAFMADLPDRRVEELAERLGRAASRAPAAELRIGGAGCFPHVARARVLWAGIEDPSDMLPMLSRRVRAACNRAGGDPAGGPFTPHVTLARLSRPADATRWVRVLGGYAGPSWTATEVALVASHLGEGPRRRPRHEVLAELPLGAPPPGAGPEPPDLALRAAAAAVEDGVR